MSHSFVSSSSLAEKSVSSITVDTMFAGIIEVPEDKVITFVEPMLGFPGLTRFVIFQNRSGPLFWLQSIEDKSVAFCIMLPFAVGLDPDYELGSGDLTDIAAAELDDILVYTVVVLDENRDKIRTNLRAPILVGRKTNRAKQLVFDDPALPMQFLLKDLPRKQD